jgi:nucleoside recognition membrane protein YjiH
MVNKSNEMKKNLLKFIIFLLLFLMPIAIANAQGDKLTNILTKIRDTLASLGYIVCGIFIIIGGYQMVIASGDPQKFETGKRTLLYSIIGVIVIAIATEIVKWIQDIVK